jgi:uncharacterized protein
MKVVITGITGLIGSALAKRLSDAGHEVVGVSRRPGPNTIVWDLEARTIDTAALEGADAIVHLAGETISGRWTADKKRRIMDSRVVSTELLASTIATLEHKPKVFVSGSAIGLYGHTGSDVVDETSPAGSGFLSEVTVAWEAAAAPIAAAGVRLVYPRTGIVLDPSGGALKPLLLATKMFVGGPLGDGKQMWAWITLHDEVEALVHLINSDLEGPVNLTAPNPVSQRVMAKQLAKILGRPSFMPAPKFAVTAVLGEMADALIFTSADVRPTKLLGSGFGFAHSTIDEGLCAALGR